MADEKKEDGFPKSKFAEDKKAERDALKKGHYGEAWNQIAYETVDQFVDMAKTAEYLREKAVDGIAAHIEKKDKQEAERVGKLGGTEARRLYEESNADIYSLHIKDGIREDLAATKLMLDADIKRVANFIVDKSDLGIAVKEAEKKYGNPSAAPKQPDAIHPLDTPVNPDKKDLSKKI